MSAGRAIRTAAVLAAVAALAPAAASAYYRTIGNGTFNVGAATLVAPTITSVTAGAGTVDLAWNAAVAPTSGVAYAVLRDGASAGGDCGTVAAPQSTTHCTDSGVGIGAHTYTVRAVWRSWTATSAGVGATVLSGPAAKLVLASSATTLAAGDPANLTVTARDAQDNVVPTYTGTKSLTFGGAGTSPNATRPTVTDRTGTPTAFGTATSLTFSGGVAAASSGAGVMRLARAESAAITVSDGSLGNGSGLPVTVNPGAAATVATDGYTAQVANISTAFASPFTALVTDAAGNAVSSATVTFTAPASGASGTFANGTRTTTATTGSSGKATSSTFTANAIAGSSTVVASTGSATSASFAVTNQTPTAANALALSNANGGATAGRPDPSDTIAVTFSRGLSPASVCPTWDGTGPLTGLTVAIARSTTNANTTLTFAASCTPFAFGALSLNQGGYFTNGGARSGTFANSSLVYDAATSRLTVTLGAYSGDVLAAVGSATATFTPASGLKDLYGQAVSTANVTSTGPQF